MGSMIQELYWAAGFIEGEGWFLGNGIGRSTHRIGAGQRQVECLERLQRLFGGKIYFTPARPRQDKTTKNSMHQWAVLGVHARAVMMTLYPLMSTRRQEKIRWCLAEWKYHIPLAGKHSRLKTHCKRGHELSGDNLRKSNHTNQRRVCIACKAFHSKEQSAARKEQRRLRKEVPDG